MILERGKAQGEGSSKLRRSLLRLGALFPLAWVAGCRRTAPSGAGDLAALAERLNEAASAVHSPSDARAFVDLIAHTFSEDAPAYFFNSAMRRRVASAEFKSVSSALIDEGRLVNGWNGYVERVGLPRSSLVRADEIHNMRDAFLATARLRWAGGDRNIWSVPAIYATGPDHKVAAGCRAVEAIRLLWDLSNMPRNLEAAKERVGEGIVISDVLGSTPISTSQGVGSLEMRVSGFDAGERAVWEYVRREGRGAWIRAVKRMVDETLS